MINLLPPDIKQSYRFAERNVSLRKWLITSAFCLLILGAIGSYGWLSMRQSIMNNDKQVADLQTTLKTAKLTETNKQITGISNSLKLAQKVLSQEILFSKLLKQMATALPDGTNLTGLNISQVSSGSALDVTVDAISYNAATQVQINLADPTNKIFERADIQNITCDEASTSTSSYPCKITLRAQFSKDNPFLFINQKQAKS
ncbi:hypothetical protein BH09PAT3_BH09PAT3_2840 [soil metagenome]